MSEWTHLNDSFPLGRKDYWCYLCGRKIPAGERHLKRSGIGEDGPDSVRMHILCEQHTTDWTIDEWEGHDSSEFAQWLDRKNSEGQPTAGPSTPTSG